MATVTTPPTISSFSPISGSAGTSVALTGTSFTGASAVLFNGVSAGFTVNSATSITAVAPGGATTGPISVTTSAGTATTSALSPANFMVVPAFTATPFNPVRNAKAAPRNTPVALTFSASVNAATAGNLRLYSAQRGGQLVRSGSATVSTSGNTITITPTTNLKPSETVFVTVPTRAVSTTVYRI